MTFNYSFIKRYFHTIKYLRFIQIYSRFRLILKLNNKKIFYRLSLNSNKQIKKWVKSPEKKQSFYEKNTFKFLNKKMRKTDWNHTKEEKLWIYNLHYFDDLNSFNANKRQKSHYNLIDRWIDENVDSSDIGWDPYPTSLRIVNWIKWSFKGNELTKKCLESLWSQTRYLSKNIEYHLLGNHLIANAKALIFAGLFFEGKVAIQIYQRGMLLLKKEFSEQILPDGAHFELSPMYHVIVLEDIYDIYNIHQMFNVKFPNIFLKKIKLMHQWMLSMTHPDGKISYFNDSVNGIATEIRNVKLYRERLFKDKFKSKMSKKSKKSFKHFLNSQYSRVETKHAVVIIDRAQIGPSYIPGHAHADTLSFELSLGQSCY